MSGERTHATPSRERGVCVQGSGQASAVKFPSQLTYHPRHNLSGLGFDFRKKTLAAANNQLHVTILRCTSARYLIRAHAVIFIGTRFGLCLWPCGRSVRRPGRGPGRRPGRGPGRRPGRRRRRRRRRRRQRRPWRRPRSKAFHLAKCQQHFVVMN